MQSSTRRLFPFVVAVVLCACGSRSAAPAPAAAPTPETSGAFVGSSPFTLDLSVADVRVRIGQEGDSVRWKMYTHPAGCAVAAHSKHELKEADRKRHCAVEWEISLPPFEVVTVDVSVGDIDVIVPSDRAVQLKTGVGDIRVRLDDRLMQHANAPGSGDRWTVGDVGAIPRLVAKVDVGAIRLDLKTSQQAP